MTGLGTIVNCAAVVVGAVIGMIFKKALKERFCELIMQSMGLAVIFIGAAGGIGRIIELNKLESGTTQIVLMVIAFALGSFFGELINIQKLTERFAAWLKIKTKSENDNSFVSGFVSASLTICVGAMAVIGPIQDALSHDYSTLFTKAVLDMVIVMVMASSMGRGTVFSVIPLAVVQGFVTLIAKLVEPLLTELAVTNISFIGSMLIFCVGINLMFDKKFRVANMLPALLFAVAFSYLPIN
ncbi:MAG: DUF554 domain-containing protein [Clostridia bacterium]|nr:DUF554 domain-containing protein [Clostridia bacterium]